jgi:uncharacterized membrane protein
MTKRAFLAELERRLYGLPKDDREEKLSFFSEIIDDKTEDGMSEEDAVKDIGSVDDIADQILRETPITTIARERVKPKRSLGGAEIILIIVSSPIWISLGIAAVSVMLSFYAALWSVLVSLWAVALAFAASGIGGILSGVAFILVGNGTSGAIMLGLGLILSGGTILLVIACRAATVITVRLTRGVGLLIKKAIIKKEYR